MSFFEDLQKVLKQNIREYGMYIALFVIIAIFTFATEGLFMSSRNISNLFNQTGYIAVLAVGMTLIIVIRHIDLSVGFLAGFLGAVAAILLVFGLVVPMPGFICDLAPSLFSETCTLRLLPVLPVYVVIPIVLVLGALAGMVTAYPVANLKIPSFVASLAGWLIYRGALQMATAGTGTIIIPDKIFNAIGNGYIPDFLPEMILFATPDNPGGVHKLTLLLGIIAVGFFIYSEIDSRRKKQAYNFEVLPSAIFVLKLILISALVLIVTWVLAGYNGISWTVVVVLVVVALYHFITTQTVIGRHIYAIGGNPEAAELSGISVKKLIYVVFGSMGLLSALSGILFTSRLQSATTTAGSLFELDAIAAAYVGGVSAAGGVGQVTGSIIGALVMMALINGMNLMGSDISVQYIVRGAVLAAAVIFDVTTRKGK